MEKAARELVQKILRGRVEFGAPMHEHTTLRVGGPADLLAYPADRDDLAALLRFLGARSLPWLVVGNGSNLLVRDGGIRGAVVNLTEGFRAVERLEDGGGSSVFRAEAGLNLGNLVRWAAEQGIGGLEALAGIPGTLGGALAMNAGAWGFEIGERTRQVEVMEPDGAVRTLARSRLRFEYRRLHLEPGSVILSAVLEGEAKAPEEIRAAAKDLLKRRRNSQPFAFPSAGSVFRNPPGSAAGRLIDGCGLKGVRNGDAEIARVHANFIVNTGSATAGQISALMGLIEERVYAKYGIRLEPEIISVGDWAQGKLRIRG
jgi:UDP-N-acetylmuramate dehydrogenase